MSSLEGQIHPLWRVVVGLVGVALFGALGVVGQGAEPRIAVGPAVAVWAVLGCALCALWALGGPAPRQPARVVRARSWAPPLGLVFAALGGLWLLLREAVAGRSWLAHSIAPFGAFALLTATLLLLAAYRLMVVVGALPRRPWYASYGLWGLWLACALQLPLLGAFGLIDPWETHYGEVSREMLARSDWVSLWWARDGWFWSKPILNFWAQGLSFWALGVETASDRVLAAAASGGVPRPEWAARLPVLVAALVGQGFLHLGVRAYAGRRAAGLSSAILATAPYWVFLSRQSMADMHYVGPLSAAVGLLLLALRAPASARARSVELRLGARGVQLSVWHLMMGVLLMSVLPQVLYLVTRNVSFAWQTDSIGFVLRADRLQAGSPGNCGLPGNVACSLDSRASRAWLQPLYAAGLWLSALVSVLLLQRRENRVGRLCYLGAWWFAALSFMAKGAPGPALLLFLFFGFLVASGRYRELRRAELGGFLLLFASVAAPWFVQEFSRHGNGFFARLFLHDMIERAFGHVHDTNAGVDTSFRYYLWQLGYGLFPWTGAVVFGGYLALQRALRWRPGSFGALRRGDLTAAMLLWALGAFGMFSVSGTKFHHYILPLVPPLCVLAGVGLDGAWRQARAPLASEQRRSSRPASAWLVAGALVAALWLGGQWALSAALGLPPQGAVLGLSGLAVGALAVVPAVASAGFNSQSRRRQLEAGLVPLGLVAAALVALAARDLVSSRAGGVEGQLRLLHLFTYNYGRPWPDGLDFRAELAGFGLAATALTGLLASRRLRRLSTRALCLLGLVWGLWICDRYMPRIAPHWGQRELLLEYYARRAGPQQPLVAYQLNWKGENFYSGNHIVDFITSGKPFQRWFEQQRRDGVTAVFFITEHSRRRTLQREVGKEHTVVELTTADRNNKFALYRVALLALPSPQEGAGIGD